MPETKIEERLISGSGLLRMPSVESAVRYFSVLVDVVREPSETNRSFRYSPYRQRFATMVGLRDGYVLFEQAIDYTRRRFDYLVSQAGQNLIALKCSHKQNLTKFEELGAAPEDSNIAEFADLSFMWDELRFVCYADTAIQVRLFQDVYDECGDTYVQKEPPVPPEPLPPVPPGTDIPDISPPYPVDDTVTDPFPGDTFPPDPPPEGTPVWNVITTERTLRIVSPDSPVTYSNFRCTTERGLQAVGHLGDNQLTQYCGDFSNYCLNEGETVVSVSLSGDYCEETYP